jgi:hypothetical protein
VRGWEGNGREGKGRGGVRTSIITAKRNLQARKCGEVGDGPVLCCDGMKGQGRAGQGMVTVQARPR